MEPKGKERASTRRDVTLGGVARQSFQPNVNARRNKKAPAAAPEPPPRLPVPPSEAAAAASSAARQRSTRSDASASPRRSPRVAAAAGGASSMGDFELEPSSLAVAAAAAPGAAAARRIIDDDDDAMETDEASVSPLPIAQQDTDAGPTWLNAPDAPLALPLRPQPYGAQPAAAGASADPWAAHAFPPESAAAALLYDDDGAPLAAESHKLLFLQMPMHLPVPAGHCERPRDDGDGDDGDDGGDGECAVSAQDYLTALTEGTGGDDAADGAGGSPRKAAAKAAAEAATTPAGLTALGDGEMGELVVYRSGAVRLQVGGYWLDVRRGADTSFDQELVAVEEAAAEVATSHGAVDAPVQLHRVGKLAQRLVLAPDLDHLLDAAAREQAAAAAAGGPVVPMDQAA